LKAEPGTEVQVVDGIEGELTVLVEGEVARKGNSLPSAPRVLDAVRETTSVAEDG